MWRIMQGVRYVGSAMMLDRVYRRVKDATATDPSLDQALERYSKAHEEMLKMEQVIATVSYTHLTLPTNREV